jgi:predicted RNA-binding protein YlqC (UPF0109 family)
MDEVKDDGVKIVEEILQRFVKLLMDPGEEAVVRVQRISRGYLFLVEATHMAPIIGKAGSTVSALRTLVGKVGARQGQRFDLELVEN